MIYLFKNNQIQAEFLYHQQTKNKTKINRVAQ